MNAGQDGFRDVKPRHRCGPVWPLASPGLLTSRIDRSHHLFVLLQDLVSILLGCACWCFEANRTLHRNRCDGRGLVRINLAGDHWRPCDAGKLVRKRHNDQLRWPHDIASPGGGPAPKGPGVGISRLPAACRQEAGRYTRRAPLPHRGADAVPPGRPGTHWRI